jgi:hypothetical protein
MILERADSTFGGIYAVIVGLYQLVGGAACCDGAFYGSGGFIVQDVEARLTAPVGKGFVHDGLGPEGFIVTPSLHRLRQNGV